MSIELTTVLIVTTFVLLLLSGLPLAWTMGATAVIISLVLFQPAIMLMMVARIFDMMLNYSVVAVPLFIFMALILQASGVAEQMFQAIHVWCGRMRGGLAIATIIACTVMAACVGIVGAEIVTLGLIALPEMLKRKYDKNLALGSICAGGGIATLIPPSIVFIFYAIVAGCSVGDLFMAGVFPGLLLAALFIFWIVVSTWIWPELAPQAPPEETNIPLRRKLALLEQLIAPGILGIIVIGSIYTGIATPTEAAAIGCLGSLVAAGLNKKLSVENVKVSLFETMKVTAMLSWLFFSAQTIIGVYTLAGGDLFVKNAVTAVPFGRWGIIVAMQLIFIFLGCFLDWVGILLLTMPLFVPIILEQGFSNVWFGVVFCMNMHISYLTPPFAPSAFYMKSVVPEGITMGDIYRSIVPYLILTIVALILVILFPEISLWLPAQMGGK